jgi:hypothetical protein
VNGGRQRDHAASSEFAKGDHDLRIELLSQDLGRAPGGQAETSRESRTIWGFRAGFRAQNSRAERCGKP